MTENATRVRASQMGNWFYAGWGIPSERESLPQENLGTWQAWGRRILSPARKDVRSWN